MLSVGNADYVSDETKDYLAISHCVFVYKEYSVPFQSGLSKTNIDF
jgi:hypothetical protein